MLESGAVDATRQLRTELQKYKQKLQTMSSLGAQTLLKLIVIDV
jgi:c-di-AMP phosphodiesterase-like protein